ncbi:hypothetical protein [Mastigocoleus testarum]|uniref:Uncharacterized protein n=1 Tax=Mastigocoleus testarum BC008 TaxID=371196 RepID=A0A0V7ZG21_9CYAN|nr:hypothetical protein [Mastigocoleus testarum]KST63525.1 hypothetical protein BC008_13760 [Mastigocoleus testarum BC008]
MEKTTDILSIGLDRLDKEQALKAFANGAELSLFVQKEDGKIRMHDYQPTNKGGINQNMRIFAVPEADGIVEYVVTDKVLKL